LLSYYLQKRVFLNYVKYWSILGVFRRNLYLMVLFWRLKCCFLFKFNRFSLRLNRFININFIDFHYFNCFSFIKYYFNFLKFLVFYYSVFFFYFLESIYIYIFNLPFYYLRSAKLLMKILQLKQKMKEQLLL
jgi:hypothetical protein